MDVPSYLHKMTDIQEKLLSFLDNEDNWENSVQQFQEYLIHQNISDQYLREFLHLIAKIAENHHRSVDFFKKIEQLILFFKDKIISNFTNAKIFNFFRKNKRILLFLIEEEIIKIDKSIISTIKKTRYNKNHYFDYFMPEITSFSLNQQIKPGEKFNENRKNGENDSYLCYLIRNDLIEEFVVYMNKNNISLVSKIDESIFETNSFLMENKNTTLIEYAAFFGSIQIFQYLRLNNVSLTSSLWNYVIHGKNADMIHLLESSNVEKDSEIKCLIEAIKCHHINIFTYINYNLEKEDLSYLPKAIKYFNFFVIPNNTSFNLYYYYLCKYDHVFLCKRFFDLQHLRLSNDILY